MANLADGEQALIIKKQPIQIQNIDNQESMMISKRNSPISNKSIVGTVRDKGCW